MMEVSDSAELALFADFWDLPALDYYGPGDNAAVTQRHAKTSAQASSCDNNDAASVDSGSESPPTLDCYSSSETNNRESSAMRENCCPATAALCQNQNDRPSSQKQLISSKARISRLKKSTSRKRVKESTTEQVSKNMKVKTNSVFTYDTLLDSPAFEALNVEYLLHAPLSKIWEQVSPEVKFEVYCDHLESGNENRVYWLASIIKIQGYYGKLRLFGFDASYDFWMSLCSPNMHPINWGQRIGIPYTFPSAMSHKFTELCSAEKLIEFCAGAKTIPEDFQLVINKSLESKYKIDDQLEVVDKDKICQLRLATVTKIIGQRLELEYVDSAKSGGFWCHERSFLIRPKGFSMTIGQNIVAPKLYSPNLLPPVYHDALFEGMSIKVGMKLEAVDPLNPSAICAATIKKVLNRGFVMIRIDCYSQYSFGEDDDWFCYHLSSPYLLPCGFCVKNNIELKPPFSYRKSSFNWDDYFQVTNTCPAPIQEKAIIGHKFKVDNKVEAVDVLNPHLICVATISKIVGRLLKIHFDGWDDEFDQWLDVRSPDILPVGWCDLTGHELYPPPTHINCVQQKKKSKK